MDKNKFIQDYKRAFGNYELPLVFWYSEQAASPLEKVNGCFFKCLTPVRNGGIVSLNVDTIGCAGGKVYTGFTEAPPFIPPFVSQKEHYKATPEQVSEFICHLNMPGKEGLYLNLASLSQVDSFEGLEGLIFFATPDVLSGLVSWAFYDTNAPDAVSVPFGSGCSATVAQCVVENQNNGQRVFLGLFDPSVRPYVEHNILSMAIPMSRFKTMYTTISQSCLQGAHAWSKVKARIDTSN
ncbi:DUF169 domain-containing protein [Carboxylicivirga taeanensis]|uniref:DUF169 domain-containing protein n=1 Tax=Carboxylicivirga taeanensis TaxID=1416875 RepID=UPI003F6E3A4A